MELEVKNLGKGELELIYSAQTIANTFTKALEDNNCILMATVDLHQRINSLYKDLEELVVPYRDNTTYYNDVPFTPLDNTSGKNNLLLPSLKSKSKSKCFPCNFDDFKGLDKKFKKSLKAFDDDFRRDLKTFKITESDFAAHLELYRQLFKLQKLDPCQAVDTFKGQCLPDILKIIAVLLSAYIALMSLKKISQLNLNAIIKGVISALIGKLIGALSISFDFGKLNIDCFLKFINEIASVVPTDQQIIDTLPPRAIAVLLKQLDDDLLDYYIRKYNVQRKPFDKETSIVYGSPFEKRAENGNYSEEAIARLASRIPKSEYLIILEDVGLFNNKPLYEKSISIQDKPDPLPPGVQGPLPQSVTKVAFVNTTTFRNELPSYVKRKTERLAKQLKEGQSGIDDIFTLINDTVNGAVKEVNAYISKISQFKTFFQCETTRSGDDLTELLGKINNYIQVLNMFSSIANALAKQTVRGYCKSKPTISKLSGLPLTEDEILLKDFLQDYQGKVVEIGNSDPTNLEIMIYDKPVRVALPKLSLLDCSIENFIKAHTLDAVLENAIQSVEEDSADEQIVLDLTPWDSYTFQSNPDAQVEIKALTDLLRTPVTRPDPPVVITEPGQPLPVDTNTPKVHSFLDTKETLGTTLKCKSIDDVLSILESF